MKFFDKFLEKKKMDGTWQEKKIVCPVNGEVIPLSEVKDPVFAQGVLGPGVGIEPDEGKIYAPVDGEVTAAYSTGHAIGIRSKDGMEILIHIGIDTVEMRGEGFMNCVKQGQKIKMGELLCKFDIEKIHQAGHVATVMVILTNANEFGKLEIDSYGKSAALAPMCEIQMDT